MPRAQNEMSEVYCPKDNGVLMLISDIVRTGTYNKNHTECQGCCNRERCHTAFAGSLVQGRQVTA